MPANRDSKEDEALLKPEIASNTTLNKKHAVIVRLGEKKILRGTRSQVRAMKEAIRLSNTQSSAKDKKRAREAESSPRGKGKKSRR